MCVIVMVTFLYLYNYDCTFLVEELAIRPIIGHLYITTYDFGYVSITTMINRTYCEAVIYIAMYNKLYDLIFVILWLYVPYGQNMATFLIAVT